MNDEKGKAMSISDDIREWCNLPQAYSIPCDELRELADRIDSEMVELPKDADGEVIHVGDTLHDRVNDMDLQVEALRFDGQWEIRTVLGYVMPRWHVHERPDSFERIADEIEKLSTNHRGISGPTLAELADRIRKLAKKEG